jgi:hypothetical protein
MKRVTHRHPTRMAKKVTAIPSTTATTASSCVDSDAVASVMHVDGDVHAANEVELPTMYV